MEKEANGPCVKDCEPSAPRCLLISGVSASRTTVTNDVMKFRESDTILAQMLEQQGFAVTLLDQLEVQPTEPVVPRTDVIVVSGTVTNGEMQKALKNLPIGIVCLNRGWWEHLGLTKTTGTWTHGKTADWMLPSSEKSFLNLWGTEEERSLEIYTKTATIYSTGRRNLAPHAIPLLGHSHGVYMFCLDSGQFLCDGSLTTARRVGMFIHCTSAGLVSPATEELLLRAVCWACNWSPRIIPAFPRAFKKMVKTILLMHWRRSPPPGSPQDASDLGETLFSKLPIELVYHIISFLVN